MTRAWPLVGLLLLLPGAAAHVLVDNPPRVFTVANHVASVTPDAPLTATHNATLRLTLTTGGVMAGHPDAGTALNWTARLGAEALAGAFNSTADGQWATALRFPGAGNWTFTLRMGSANGTTVLPVHPHLGYAAQALPASDPPAQSPFVFRFRFVREEHAQAPLPGDAAVRLERRGLDERRLAILQEAVAAPGSNGTWQATVSVPAGEGYHLTVASRSGGFGHDGLPAFSVAAGPGAQAAGAPWPLLGLLAAALLGRVMKQPARS